MNNSAYKLIIAIVLLICFNDSFTFSQSLLAKWTFPTGTAVDSIADGGITTNLNSVIKCLGGTSAIDFTKKGFTTLAARTTNWDNGNGTKFWQIEISTLGYDSLTLSSMLQSGNANPGPRDFKIQYAVGAFGVWTDIVGGNIRTADDWVTGVTDSLRLPLECSNINSLFIRWIMNSDTSSAGGIIAPTGLSKIDEIYVYGKEIQTLVNKNLASQNVFINFNYDLKLIYIFSTIKIDEISVYDISGRIIIKQTNAAQQCYINTDAFDKGLYIVVIRNSMTHLNQVRKIVI